MFIDADLIAYDFMTDFNGIERHFPTPYYPAGVYDEDKPIYKDKVEDSKYPTLTLPCDLYDMDGNIIPNGFYMVALSLNKKYLNLYQSNELKARIKIIKLVETMYSQDEINEEMEIKGRIQWAKEHKKLKKLRKAEEDLEAFNQKKAAESNVEIFDSGKNYYILKYNHNGKKATGVILK